MTYSNSECMKIRRYVINLVSNQKDIVQLPTIMELSKMFGISRPMREPCLICTPPPTWDLPMPLTAR